MRQSQILDSLVGDHEVIITERFLMNHRRKNQHLVARLFVATAVQVVSLLLLQLSFSSAEAFVVCPSPVSQQQQFQPHQRHFMVRGGSEEDTSPISKEEKNDEDDDSEPTAELSPALITPLLSPSIPLPAISLPTEPPTSMSNSQAVRGGGAAATSTQTKHPSVGRRLWSAMPGRKSASDLDSLILKTALPAMANLAIVPIVSSIETVWIGRMGLALALAGQSAANSAFLTSFFLISFLPTMAAPLVAGAIGAGKKEEARQRISETLFLCNVLGAAGTIFMSCYPRVILRLVIPPGAPAMDYAAPYLRWRALSMIPELITATGFASFRGMLDTVTPLKISSAGNLLKTILDPILLFCTPLGFIGPPFATLAAETLTGAVNLRLLFKNKLVNLARLIKPPSLKDLAPLLSGGAIMMTRQMAINVGMLYSGRCAQSIDPSGVAAAAYGIVMQMYTVGFVVHVAMQGAAAALVPSKLAQAGTDGARQMADRLFAWSLVVGLSLGAIQFAALTFLVPVFTTLPEVQQAVRLPAILASMLHVVNGPRFAGEGTLMGLCAFRDLTIITVMGISIMVVALSSSLGTTLPGIMMSNLIFCSFQTIALLTHYLCIGRLAYGKNRTEQMKAT